MKNSMQTVMVKSGSSAQDDGAFYLQEQPIPEPEPNDILVKIIAIGMNPVDTKVRVRTPEDRVLGWDAHGLIEKVGSEVNGYTPGDAVFYAGDLTRPGCNSEYQLVDHRLVAHAPKKLSAEDSAAMPLTSITAWEGLFDRLGFIPKPDANRGRSILIIGGAGGVGSMAIQLARWAGLKVLATASRPETIEWCKKLGAEVILNHRNPLEDELVEQGEAMVDAIFCTTEMERHWQAMAECIKPQGKIVLIDDPTGPLDITVFKFKSVSLHWEFMYTRSMFSTDDMVKQSELLTEIAQLLDSGIICSTRQETTNGLTPENIRSMHIKQESGAMMGKQVLVL